MAVDFKLGGNAGYGKVRLGTHCPPVFKTSNELLRESEHDSAAQLVSQLCAWRSLRYPLTGAVEAILDGRQPVGHTLAVIMRPFVLGWDKQQISLIGSQSLWMRR